MTETKKSAAKTRTRKTTKKPVPTPPTPLGQLIPTMELEADPNQPRKSFDDNSIKELAYSIEAHGMLNPITVRKNDSGGYTIVAGERRWRAAVLAGWDDVPAIVMELEGHAVVEAALVENILRDDLNPIEEARGYAQLRDDYDMRVNDIAKRFGKSRSVISNKIRLLDLPDVIIQSLIRGDVSDSIAIEVLPIVNMPEENLRFVEQHFVERADFEYWQMPSPNALYRRVAQGTDSKVFIRNTVRKILERVDINKAAVEREKEMAAERRKQKQEIEKNSPKPSVGEPYDGPPAPEPVEGKPSAVNLAPQSGSAPGVPSAPAPAPAAPAPAPPPPPPPMPEEPAFKEHLFRVSISVGVNVPTDAAPEAEQTSKVMISLQRGSGVMILQEMTNLDGLPEAVNQIQELINKELSS